MIAARICILFEIMAPIGHEEIYANGQAKNDSKETAKNESEETHRDAFASLSDLSPLHFKFVDQKFAHVATASQKISTSLQRPTEGHFINSLVASPPRPPGHCACLAFPALKKMENTDDDYSDLVCGICKSGGDMICCDGKCLRSFHPNCIGLKEEDIPEDSPFVCSDCFSGIQRCFVCYHFGLENELVKCSVTHCGKFYHPNCVNTSLESDSYVCKLHSCDSCGEVITNPSKRNSLWRCFRCPKAFDTKHRPRDVHVLAEGLFLCIRHTQEEEVWPEMSKSLADRLEKRNQQVTHSLSFAPPSSFSCQQSADWGDKNSNGLPTNASSNRNFSLSEKNEKPAANPNSNAYRPGESEQARQKRLKQEEKDRLENEATLRASSIMPKKLQSSNDTENGGDEDDDNSPRFSPASVGEDDDHEQQPPHSDHRNPNSPSLSHLAKHNEYRRQRKRLWNQSWNQYRDIQDESMGIRRREEYYHQPLPTYSSSPFSFMTSLPGPMDHHRPNSTLLSSSYPISPASSFGESMRSSSSAILMRTNALLTQLNHSDHQNKRLKYESYPPAPAPPPPSLAPLASHSIYPSSGFPPPDHRSYETAHNYNGSRFDLVPETISSSGRSFPSSLSSGGGSVMLSRTEQLLAKTSSSSTPSHPSYSYPSSSSSSSSVASSVKPILSRTEQILAKTAAAGPSYQSNRLAPSSHPTSSTTAPVPHQGKLKENKMNATDLFAMLQASGLLPTK
jgi:hypothetical protein